jgi:hypothetical protein
MEGGMSQERNQSDVARLLAEIDLQYQAAQLALSGQAVGVSQHQFITARLERIEDARQELVNLVGDPDEASRLVIEQMNKSAQEPKET